MRRSARVSPTLQAGVSKVLHSPYMSIHLTPIFGARPHNNVCLGSLRLSEQMLGPDVWDSYSSWTFWTHTPWDDMNGDQGSSFQPPENICVFDRILSRRYWCTADDIGCVQDACLWRCMMDCLLGAVVRGCYRWLYPSLNSSPPHTWPTQPTQSQRWISLLRNALLHVWTVWHSDFVYNKLTKMGGEKFWICNNTPIHVYDCHKTMLHKQAQQWLFLQSIKGLKQDPWVHDYDDKPMEGVLCNNLVKTGFTSVKQVLRSQNRFYSRKTGFTVAKQVLRSQNRFYRDRKTGFTRKPSLHSVKHVLHAKPVLRLQNRFCGP